MTGGNSSNSLGDEDLLLVKVDKFGNSGCQNGPYNPNVFSISSLTAINYNLYTTNVISYANFQPQTITPSASKNFICGVVPVELKSFNYQIEKNNIVLRWTTSTEINNHGFEIERCSEGGEWITIGFVEGKGTTTEIQDYSYADDLFGVTSWKVFYRLKQVDYNGSFKYSSEIVVGTPSTYLKLGQNYPNPFNPITSIRYSLPRKGYTKLIVYNYLGCEIIKLVDGIKDVGTYQVEFDGKDLPSGTYFYTIITNDFKLAKKMILLK
jgi:hypothetical protein